MFKTYLCLLRNFQLIQCTCVVMEVPSTMGHLDNLCHIVFFFNQFKNYCQHSNNSIDSDFTFIQLTWKKTALLTVHLFLAIDHNRIRFENIERSQSIKFIPENILEQTISKVQPLVFMWNKALSEYNARDKKQL